MAHLTGLPYTCGKQRSVLGKLCFFLPHCLSSLIYKKISTYQLSVVGGPERSSHGTVITHGDDRLNHLRARLEVGDDRGPDTDGRHEDAGEDEVLGATRGWVHHQQGDVLSDTQRQHYTSIILVPKSWFRCPLLRPGSAKQPIVLLLLILKLRFVCLL